MGLLSFGAYAQQTSEPAERVQMFRHWDLGVAAGTTGLALELSTPVTPWLHVRAGLNYMPQFNIPMNFGLESFDSEGMNTHKFKNMQQLLKEYMDIDIDEYIKMNAKCTMTDVKLLLDFYPLRNHQHLKHWHLTAGVLWGRSRIGHIENTVKEMTTLVGIVTYNQLYDYFTDEKYIDEPIYNDIYLSPETGDMLRDKFLEYGRVGAHVGDFKSNGDPYIMVPDKNCMVQANMYVNRLKPYLGVGYQKAMGSDQRWNFGFDLGFLFWGGVPRIITHPNLNMLDGHGVPRTVNMSKELAHIPGKVGTLVDITKVLKVYPALSIKLAYKIF